MLTMQDALLALTDYWTERGCMIVQSFNTEVGAGTLNPATVLRVLGPEPWRVAYVEPSVRPDDARYGENPNRLQTHTQFQVILKPDPGDPQELFLGSLRALEIDVRAHDVRFVEDNWASPALGAWGLGWEVWLDGLEITQFTYFQQAGGVSLDPVSVEITYGIERTVMALQGVDHFKQITYAPGISYSEAFGQAEYEMSRYYLDEADVATARRLFDDYAQEAQRMVDARLPVPAHYLVLKCSHAFNVLDARGAVSSTERAAAFGRMRLLSREIASLWQERRRELGYPLGVFASPALPAPATSRAALTGPATLLLEIGTEELPSAEVGRAAGTVRDALSALLAATRLGHGKVSAYATPRRIVALVDEVQPREPDAERTVRGPRVSAAFDADGQPTAAARGFARSHQADVTDLRRIDIDGTEYVSVSRTSVGRGAVEVVAGLLAQLVSGLRGEKNMRWGDPALSFARPVRWLLALLDDVEVPVAVSALASGRTTRVHRTADSPVVEVPTARGYLDFLAAHGIVADAAVRRERVAVGAQRLAAQVGGGIDVHGDAALLDEIANLVEEPTPLLGSFDERYLELPPEVLTTVMRDKQRYLPVRDVTGTLMQHFVMVANGACDAGLVRAGNEAVLRARYEDAAFFWRADLTTQPEAMKKRLRKLAFADRLGTMAERAERIAGIARTLTLPGAGSEPLIALTQEEQDAIDRAAQLNKFDLGSQLVIEFTSLAGTMAREYGRRSGESGQVTDALFEMELPRYAGDALPRTAAGAVLAVADRLDLLAALFSVGVKPTGSSDPFGLRRAAIGAVSILRSVPVLRPLTLAAGFSVAAQQLRQQGVDVPAATLTEVRDFVIRRYEQQLLDAGQDARRVAAVLPLADAPAVADETLAELDRRAADQRFGQLVAALQRARRILPPGTPAAFDPDLLTEPAERSLADAFETVRAATKAARSLREFTEAADLLVTPINDFFDQVLVMSDIPAIRAARLGLLASIQARASSFLDWQAIEAPDARPA